MGRRPDPPELQKAKGSPRQRGRKRVEAMEVAAARAAELLAAAPAENTDPLAPPAFLDQRFPEALAVWRMYAPELARTWRLQSLHRPTFALFCVYYGEWVRANEDIAKNGYTQKVQTIAGGVMERRRPEVDRRERAFANALDLSKHFGLTPHDEYVLFRDQRMAAANNPGLFPDRKSEQDEPPSPRAEPPGAHSAAAPPPSQQSGIGSMSMFDSAPPGRLPN